MPMLPFICCCLALAVGKRSTELEHPLLVHKEHESSSGDDAFHNSGTMEWHCVRINFVFLVLIILVSLPRSAIDPSKSFPTASVVDISYLCHITISDLAGLAAAYGLNFIESNSTSSL
ncbi:hypothetical protein V6N11_083423 [Hibiscus sabdariffa]|uniref:Uncharacterized protein n=1 Tax=Hibiscus sabdariffa TaxID=183260 RepID=A0ABR2QM78_9ROSI